MTDVDADYIVVGAGASGCVVAARLAERGFRVLLLEAGGADANPLFRIPGLGFMVSLNPRYNWNFQTEPVSGLNGRVLTLLQGRVVGGSSSINGMMYNRGSVREFDLWRQLGCAGWTYEELVPFFKKVEKKLAGQTGELEKSSKPLSQNSGSLAIYEAFLRAAEQTGNPVRPDLTTGESEGFGLYHTNIVGGRRISAATAYLRPALKSGNLTLRTNAQVRRVVIEQGAATGVEISGPNGIVNLRARREVVLCGGGIKSPQLLLLSGVGPGQHLREFGISVVVESSRVGANLQNHPSYRMQFTCRAAVTAYSSARPAPALLQGARYVLGGRGILGETIFGAGGYVRTDPRLEFPDVQVVLAGGLNPPFAGPVPNLLRMLPRQQGFTAIVYQGTPYSVGRVSLRSPDPDAPPRIDANYFGDARDIEVLSKGIRRVRDIAKAPALESLGVEEIAPGARVESDAEMEDAIRTGASTAYHQSGTCAMGGGPESVVDPELRVRGVARLRVADASVIPRLLNAGLHGPSLLIGEKAASLIVGQP